MKGLIHQTEEHKVHPERNGMGSGGWRGMSGSNLNSMITLTLM